MNEWKLVPVDDPKRSFADPAIPFGMVAAGIDAYERAKDEMKHYKAGKTIDWDAGMIVVAIYRAMVGASPDRQPASAASLLDAAKAFRKSVL